MGAPVDVQIKIMLRSQGWEALYLLFLAEMPTADSAEQGMIMPLYVGLSHQRPRLWLLVKDVEGSFWHPCHLL